MTKRKKFLVVSSLLSLGLLAAQFTQVEFRYQALAVLGFLAYGLSAWALFDDLRSVGWLTILTLPAFYPVSVGLFYFLLPEKFLSRVIILGLFGLGMYALLLTANIFSVAAIRTIQLLRAAHAVGFLMTLITAFFGYDTILSFRLPFWLVGGLVLVISLPLVLQALWSVELNETVSKQIWALSGGIALGLAELAVAIFFWPVTIPVGSLFLTSMLYVALGISQQRLLGRLFQRTLYEYVGVGVVVFATVVLITRWK